MLDRFLAVDVDGEEFADLSTPSRIEEDEVAEELEPVEEVVIWFASSREPARPSGPSWALSSLVRSAELRSEPELLWLSCATSSAVSSTTLQHFMFWLTTSWLARMSEQVRPTGRSTRNVRRSESDITPITWSSLSTTMIRCTWQKSNVSWMKLKRELCPK